MVVDGGNHLGGVRVDYPGNISDLVRVCGLGQFCDHLVCAGFKCDVAIDLVGSILGCVRLHRLENLRMDDFPLGRSGKIQKPE